jgi:hypothetical protein
MKCVLGSVGYLCCILISVFCWLKYGIIMPLFVYDRKSDQAVSF